MKASVFSILACLAVAACSDVPEGDPQHPHRTGFRGHTYKTAAIIDTNGRLYWAQQAMSGYEISDGGARPATIIEQQGGPCDPHKPLATDRVQHVHVVEGTQILPIYELSNNDANKRAERFVKTYLRTRGKPRRISAASKSDAFSVVNVLVTDTSKPIYLVLTGQTKIIWNIQYSDQVKINRIVVIGKRTAGVANAPKGVPVDFLVGDYMTSCEVAPARMPEAHWRFVRNSGGMDSGHQAVEDNISNASIYASWFASAFFAGVTDGVPSAVGLSNALIGPLPEGLGQRVSFRSIHGAEIVMPFEGHVMVGSWNDYKTKARSLILDAARTAAGGDLKRLLGNS